MRSLKGDNNFNKHLNLIIIGKFVILVFFSSERPSTNIIRTPSSHSAGSDSGNEEDVESEQKV